jgi:uncharacterized membrane-anchored protein
MEHAMRRFGQRLVAGLAAFALSLGLAAAQPAPPTAEQRHSEARAAFQAAMAAAVRGPGQTGIADEATLQLPEHVAWVQGPPSIRLMRAMGNVPSEHFLGLLVGRDAEQFWFATVSYTASGFIKDDDSRDLNADDLLQNLRENTGRANEDRVARGFKPLDITGWLQPPAYDAVNKRLVWALSAVTRGEAAAPATVNYNTRVLGRSGYISLNMLTDSARFTHDKAVADGLLTGLAYDQGKRYADFNASTDHVAAYGLAALIGVVALKKLGLIAVATAFFLKFAKLGAIAVVGLGAAVRKLLRGRRAGA